MFKENDVVYVSKKDEILLVRSVCIGEYTLEYDSWDFNDGTLMTSLLHLFGVYNEKDIYYYVCFIDV